MKMSVWSLTWQQRVFKRYQSGKHFSEFYPQDGGEKTAGTGMDRNYVTVTVCIVVECLLCMRSVAVVSLLFSGIIAISVSVCLSVCLSDRISQNRMVKLRNIFGRLHRSRSFLFFRIHYRIPQTVCCYLWAYLFSTFNLFVFTLVSCRFRAVD